MGDGAPGDLMSKPQLPAASAPASAAAAESAAGAPEVHPEDRVYSGMFGHGQVVELLKNAEGYAYGHRVLFENGMEAELLITGLPVRH